MKRKPDYYKLIRLIDLNIDKKLNGMYDNA
jgi:hypothetical protein